MPTDITQLASEEDRKKQQIDLLGKVLQRATASELDGVVIIAIDKKGDGKLFGSFPEQLTDDVLNLLLNTAKKILSNAEKSHG